MTTSDRTPGPAPGERPDPIGQLIARAGARTDPPESARQTVLAAVEREWSSVVAGRRRARARRWLAAASVAALVVGLSWLAIGRWSSTRTGPAATFLAALGRVDIARGGSAAPVVAGDTVLAGTRVRTEPMARALFSIDGVSVRVGGATEVTFERADLLHLTAGRVYVDSGMQHAGAAVSTQIVDVETALGTVRHVGTQFEVEVDPQHLTVRVRDGRVKVNAGSSALTLGAADQVVIDIEGAVARSSVAPFGDVWAWTSDLTPAFPIEGRSFEEFLRWFAHESGRRLQFDSPATEAAAADTRLSGNIAGLRPREALEAIEATTRFACDLSDPSALRVSMRASLPGAARDIPANAKLPDDAEVPRQPSSVASE
jgi:ferric-dicitrate binding protein FerR (iron transport regulator)